MTYYDSFEIDNSGSIGGVSIVIENCLCQLWCIMASIALPCNVEIPVFVFWKSVEPIHQEIIVVYGCSSIPVVLHIRRHVRIRKPNSCW